MAQQTINVGSSPNSGGGDSLRDAMIKINENFTEVYANITALEDGNIVTDIKGNVFAEDSTLLVDAVNGSIPWSVISGTPTSVAGYGITDADAYVPQLAAAWAGVPPTTIKEAIDRLASAYLTQHGTQIP